LESWLLLLLLLLLPVELLQQPAHDDNVRMTFLMLVADGGCASPVVNPAQHTHARKQAKCQVTRCAACSMLCCWMLC
jgi:hypothetical protein